MALKFPDLTSKDRELGLEFSIKVMEANNWAELIQLTLNTLVDTKSISSATWNEANPDLSLYHCPSTGVEQDYVDSFLPVINERLPFDHPVHTNVDLTDPSTLPAQRSEFMSDRQFQNTGLYQDAYKHLEEFHQICCPLYSGQEGNIVLTLGRDKLSYTKREMQFIQMIRDIATSKCSQLIHSAKQQETFMGLFSAFQGESGLVRIDSQFRVKRMNLAAANMIEEYFSFNPHCGKLPTSLQEFVKTVWLQCMKMPSQEISPTSIIKGKNKGLVFAQLLTGAAQDDKLLLLKPANQKESFSHHEWEHLTQRETETLHWLVRGYSQKEIAVKLGISYNTVRSTVRNIANKLHLKKTGNLM